MNVKCRSYDNLLDGRNCEEIRFYAINLVMATITNKKFTFFTSLT